MFLSLLSDAIAQLSWAINLGQLDSPEVARVRTFATHRIPVHRLSIAATWTTKLIWCLRYSDEAPRLVHVRASLARVSSATAISTATSAVRRGSSSLQHEIQSCYSFLSVARQNVRYTSRTLPIHPLPEKLKTCACMALGSSEIVRSSVFYTSTLAHRPDSLCALSLCDGIVRFLGAQNQDARIAAYFCR